MVADRRDPARSAAGVGRETGPGRGSACGGRGWSGGRGWRPGRRSRLGLGWLLRWLSPASSCGSPGRAPKWRPRPRTPLQAESKRRSAASLSTKTARKPRRQPLLGPWDRVWRPAVSSCGQRAARRGPAPSGPQTHRAASLARARASLARPATGFEATRTPLAAHREPPGRRGGGREEAGGGSEAGGGGAGAARPEQRSGRAGDAGAGQRRAGELRAPPRRWS